MRIANKITLSLLAMGCLTFGGIGWLLVTVEQHDLRIAAEKEIRTLARTIHTSAEQSSAESRDDVINQIIHDLEKTDPELKIWWLDENGVSLSSFTPSERIPISYLQQLDFSKRNNDEETARFYPSTHPQHLVIVTSFDSLPDNGQRAGSIIIQRTLNEMQRDLTVTRNTIAQAVGSFVLFTLIIGWAMGYFYVTRPLNAFMGAMRQVREGQYTSWPGYPASSSELRELANEFNTMVEGLREARASLENEAERRRALQRDLERANKMITIGQLSAELAHEIGSPLQILGGRAELLATLADDPDAVRRNAQILQEQTERISRIVEQLMSHTRHRPSRLETADLATLIANMVDFLMIEAARRQIQITFRHEHNLPHVRIDPDQIQQVILNLISNAFEAIGRQGEIIINLKTTLCQLHSNDVATHCLITEIKDNGSGIAQENAEQVFEPFFTTRDQQSGTGLGLTVCKSLVEQNGGSISFESQLSQGTTFIITLPVHHV